MNISDIAKTLEGTLVAGGESDHTVGTVVASDWIRSMGFGAGVGLSSSKRVSDTFDIVSKIPTGTTVMCGFKVAS